MQPYRSMYSYVLNKRNSTFTIQINGFEKSTVKSYLFPDCLGTKTYLLQELKTNCNNYYDTQLVYCRLGSEVIRKTFSSAFYSPVYTNVYIITAIKKQNTKFLQPDKLNTTLGGKCTSKLFVTYLSFYYCSIQC